MKETCKKISDVLKTIFGYGIMFSLFAGGLTFFGFMVALIIGGDTATMICSVISTKVYPVIIYTSTIMVLLGLVSMYLAGEMALTASKKESSKHEGEL